MSRRERQPKVIVSQTADGMQEQADNLLLRDSQHRDIVRDTQEVKRQVGQLQRQRILQQFQTALFGLQRATPPVQPEPVVQQRDPGWYQQLVNTEVGQRAATFGTAVRGMAGRIRGHIGGREERIIEEQIREGATLAEAFDAAVNRQGNGLRSLNGATREAINDARSRVEAYDTEQNQSAEHRQDVVASSAFVVAANEQNQQVRDFGQRLNNLTRAAAGVAVEGLTKSEAQQILNRKRRFHEYLGADPTVDQRLQQANVTEDTLRAGIQERVRTIEVQHRAGQAFDAEILADHQVALVGLERDIQMLPADQQRRARRALGTLGRAFDVLARPVAGVAVGAAGFLAATGGVVAMLPEIIAVGGVIGVGLSAIWVAKRIGQMRKARNEAARVYRQDLMGGLQVTTAQNTETRRATWGRIRRGIFSRDRSTREQARGELGGFLLRLMSPGRQEAFIARLETEERRYGVVTARELLDGERKVQPSVAELITELQQADSADRVLTLWELESAMRRQAELAVLGQENQNLTHL